MTDTMVNDARQRLADRKARGGGFVNCAPDTDLVVEGPPRSANSFTVRMLQTLTGKAPRLKIAHHSHSADNLISGAAYGIPLVVLARPPEDAILSYCIYSGLPPEKCANRYVGFYEALANVDGYIIGHFDEITHDFNAFLARLNTILPRPLPLIEDMPALLAEVDAVQKAAVEKRAREQASDPIRQTPMPTAGREALKADMREEVLAHLAANPLPRKIYDSFVAAGDKPRASSPRQMSEER